MKDLQICCGTSRTTDIRQICNSRSLIRNSPPHFANDYPWLVTYDSESRGKVDHIFCTMPNLPSQWHHYHCRIPQLLGRDILGCFHGWLILCSDSGNFECCLWNLATLKVINLPCFELKPEGDTKKLSEDITSCCLSSPPSALDSVILLAQVSSRSILFSLVHSKRRKWKQMSYADQMRKLSDYYDDTIISIGLCNGKLYATTSGRKFMQIDLRVHYNSKGKKEAVITLLAHGTLAQFPGCVPYHYLLGCEEELFLICESFENLQFKEIRSVNLFRLNFSAMTWEEVKSIKNRVFFLTEYSQAQTCCPASAVESEMGSYIHIVRESCKLYSYNIEDKTMSQTFLPCPDLAPGRNRSSMWVMPESRLVGDHGEGKCSTNTTKDQVKVEEKIVIRSVITSDVDGVVNELLGENTESFLLTMPLHMLELIAQYCVADEYLNLRATCKKCLLAAPSKQWNIETALDRLRNHSLASPWLMICDKDQGIFTFFDAKSGDKYFMSIIPESIGDAVILYSRYGWLLIFKDDHCVDFLNPFTKATVQLAPFPRFSVVSISSFCFSAPPTSPDCVVVGFAEYFDKCFYFTSPGKLRWFIVEMNPPDTRRKLSSHNSVAFLGKDLYVMSKDGELGRVRFDTNSRWEILITEPPRASCILCTQRFLVECDGDLLAIFVAEYGEWVEVFKLNSCLLGWEKVDDLGKHMIYVCGRTSFSVVAKDAEMENKIYFPRFCDGNIVCYSLSTRNHHTFDYKGNGQSKEFSNFLPTKKLLSSVWIEPSWAIS